MRSITFIHSQIQWIFHSVVSAVTNKYILHNSILTNYSTSSLSYLTFNQNLALIPTFSIFYGYGLMLLIPLIVLFMPLMPNIYRKIALVSIIPYYTPFLLLHSLPSSSSLVAVKAHLQSYPTPLVINFLWNLGFFLCIAFVMQIVTGLYLASNYTADVSLAYYSVQYIIREVGSGWSMRLLHATGASTLMALTYIHILRSYCGSTYYLPISWYSGIILFFLCIVICFLGYVLPWGQMSFWGATVITNLLSPIPLLVNWICGGYFICNSTLKRFFMLHFALTFLSLVVIVLHIFYLHIQGGLNPLGYNSILKIPFSPNIMFMDIKGLSNITVLFLFQTMFGLLTLSHPDNSCEVNRFNTPLHIVPEWYFLSFYAMLKVVPAKNAGLLIATASILILFLFGEQRDTSTLINQNTSHISHSRLMIFSFYCLWWIGAELPQIRFINFGRVFLLYYFLFGILYLNSRLSKRYISTL